MAVRSRKNTEQKKPLNGTEILQDGSTFGQDFALSSSQSNAIPKSQPLSRIEDTKTGPSLLFETDLGQNANAGGARN